MIPKQPPKPTKTRPGLGLEPEDQIPRLDSAQLEKARAQLRTPSPDSVTTPPASARARVPREDEDAPRSQQFGSRTTAVWGEEAPSGPRSRRPLTVDSVGDAATRIARTTRQTSPKVVATAATIAGAPLDSRSAFILSLVDGTSDVPAIVDAAGMPADEVIGILARLARLGLISVP